MKADQSLFVLDLNERRSDSTNLVWSIAEVLYYPSRENKGADQLCGYCEADLHLCFCICKMLVFSRRGSNIASLTWHD